MGVVIATDVKPQYTVVEQGKLILLASNNILHACECIGVVRA